MKMCFDSVWLRCGFVVFLLILGGCRGPAGPDGATGGSCSVTSNADGSATIVCEDGSSATVTADAGSCTVTDNGDGTSTLTCEDGTSTVISNGETGAAGSSCTVVDNGDGTKTITCEDGTSVVVSDGQNGQDGEDGLDGEDAASTATTFYLAAEVPSSLVVEVLRVTIVDKPVVEFTLKDGAGRGAVGAVVSSSGGNLRFGLDKLVPGSGGNSDAWQSYINRVSSGYTQATTDRAGTLVDHLNGSYTYTFSVDVTQAVDPVSGEAIAYDPTLTHRLAVQLSGSVNGVSLPWYNAVYDFVPGGGEVTHQREIVSTSSCNECHGELVAHGSRYETKYCVTCHNTGTFDPTTGKTVDFSVMIHGIHSSAQRAAAGAPAYVVGDNDYSEVTFPQDTRNCLKCHNGADADTPSGDNWKTKPSMEACSSCHATMDFSTHKGGQTSNANCAGCHNPSVIAEDHGTDNLSENNPSTPAGAYNFTYEIRSASATDLLEPRVDFRILKDGTPLNFSALPSDLTGSPSFLVGYSVPQQGITSPGDWNQGGLSAAQPSSVTIANLINGTQGNLVGPDTDGFYTGTLTATAAHFPADATMRSISLQGYYSQTNFGGTTTTLGRHTVSVQASLTDDPQRRQVVDNQKCGSCHEWIEAHGGNRVYTTQVCSVCHNPNLTSSGRGADVANISSDTAAALTAAGYDPADPLTFPEESNSLKVLIHGIHSAELRDTPYEFVRDRGTSGVFYYNFQEVTFPGVLNECTTCHMEGTYGTDLADNLAVNTDRISDGTDVSPAAVKAARATVPNNTDQVSTPLASTCYSCHTNEMARAHIEDNGGLISVPRVSLAEGYVETCDLCHGAGRTADVDLVHGML